MVEQQPEQPTGQKIDLRTALPKAIDPWESAVSVDVQNHEISFDVAMNLLCTPGQITEVERHLKLRRELSEKVIEPVGLCRRQLPHGTQMHYANIHLTIPRGVSADAPVVKVARNNPLRDPDEANYSFEYLKRQNIHELLEAGNGMVRIDMDSKGRITESDLTAHGIYLKSKDLTHPHEIHTQHSIAIIDSNGALVDMGHLNLIRLEGMNMHTFMVSTAPQGPMRSKPAYGDCTILLMDSPARLHELFEKAAQASLAPTSITKDPAVAAIVKKMIG